MVVNKNLSFDKNLKGDFLIINNNYPKKIKTTLFILVVK